MARIATAAAVMTCLCAAARADAEDRPGPGGSPRVPIIYSSDLFHPHDDPDDHFDLATLFALSQFDIRAIVLDLGDRQVERPGAVPLKQMMRLTGRSVPYAIGLGRRLRSPDDAGADQEARFQAGVNLILRALRESKGPVTIVQTGSLRDIAAAFNREPALLRSKVARLYMNTGHSGGDKEWNVGLDPHAYVRVMRSGLPIYWGPCFGPEGYGSLWKFRHDRVLDAASPQLQNFFIYALAKADPAKLDPIAALTSGLEPSAKAAMWTAERNMWSTASLLHAAGLETALSPEGTWRARPIDGDVGATTRSSSSRLVRFEKRRIRLDADGKTTFDDRNGDVTVLVFRRGDERAYNQAMTDVLRDLLHNLGR